MKNFYQTTFTSVTKDESMLNISNHDMVSRVFLSKRAAWVAKASLCWWLLVILISFEFSLCHDDGMSHCCADAISSDTACACNLKNLYFQAFWLSTCQPNHHASTKISNTCPLILRLFWSSEISYIITSELPNNCSEEGRKFDWCISPS